jgi:hypothetical protein
MIVGAVESALKPHVDDDTCEYIASLLEEDAADEDAREAVSALIEGAVEGCSSQIDSQQLCRVFFELLDLQSEDMDNNMNGNANGNKMKQNDEKDPLTGVVLRKLDLPMTMKDKDVQTFASGLRADAAADPAADEEQPSKIAAFYANMIDVSVSSQSERIRRKARQKEIRERMEEEERQRAIEEAMAMLSGVPDATGGTTENEEKLMEASASDNAQDVHFRRLDLPNLRGGGANLLTDASITLARGHRYGFMGRNGCGAYMLLYVMFTISHHVAFLVIIVAVQRALWVNTHTHSCTSSSCCCCCCFSL